MYVCMYVRMFHVHIFSTNIVPNVNGGGGSGGLSGGAIAGIVIGIIVAVGIVIIILIIVFLCYRKMQNKDGKDIRTIICNYIRMHSQCTHVMMCIQIYM